MADQDTSPIESGYTKDINKLGDEPIIYNFNYCTVRNTLVNAIKYRIITISLIDQAYAVWLINPSICTWRNICHIIQCKWLLITMRMRYCGGLTLYKNQWRVCGVRAAELHIRAIRVSEIMLRKVLVSTVCLYISGARSRGNLRLWATRSQLKFSFNCDLTFFTSFAIELKFPPT